MILGFLFNIKCLILFVWALQTFCLRRRPIAIVKYTRKRTINVYQD